MHISIPMHTMTSLMLRRNNQSLNQLVNQNIKISLVIKKKIQILTLVYMIPIKMYMIIKITIKHHKAHNLHQTKERSRTLQVRLMTPLWQMKIKRYLLKKVWLTI